MRPLLLLAALSAGTAAPAYPIPPQPLRKLFVEAELVVVAVPGRSVAVPERPDDWDQAAVPLAIRRVLKGDPALKEVTVFHKPNLICPAPDTYPEGKTVVAFLHRHKTRDGYRAPGLSYASKVLEPRALEAFVARVEELAKIPDAAAPSEPSRELVEWAVKCAENPATRWDGACEFSWAVLGRDEKAKPISVRRLDESQVGRLYRGLLETWPPGHAEAHLASTLAELREPRVDSYLARGIREIVGRPEPPLEAQILAEALLRALFSRGASPAAGKAVLDLDAAETDYPRKLQILRDAARALP